jgi:hypothetical protein
MSNDALRYMTTDCSSEDSVTPEGLYGPYLTVSEAEADAFNDVLCDEIDSDYASSLCCCDFCVDDFKSQWPDVAFREMAFQTQSMDMDWYLESARIGSLYTAAERSTLRHFVVCPRCNETGSCNVWVYEHRFSDVAALEGDIKALLAVAAETPFLLLEHPFARRVLEEVRRQAGLVLASVVDGLFYRARLEQDVLDRNQLPNAIETYGAPPAPVVKEGRFNHAGAPMLYLATSEAVAAAELGAPGEACFVGALAFRTKLSVLDLVDIDEMDPGHDLLLALAQSALLLAPNTGEGWVRRQYVFSRFVADCARNAGFDAIRYGSTKQAGGSNYVVLEPAEAIATATLVGWTPQIVPPPERRW